VIARLLFVGVAWLAAAVLFAVLLEWSGTPASHISPTREGVTALARSLNALRPSPASGGHDWSVTKANSALGSLIVEVDAMRPENAQRIAEHLVSRVSGYDQVLVYVQKADDREARIRRIEWTRRRGYLASAF
jgi:hypothetical protein